MGTTAQLGGSSGARGLRDNTAPCYSWLNHVTSMNSLPYPHDGQVRSVYCSASMEAMSRRRAVRVTRYKPQVPVLWSKGNMADTENYVNKMTTKRTVRLITQLMNTGHYLLSSRL